MVPGSHNVEVKRGKKKIFVKERVVCQVDFKFKEDEFGRERIYTLVTCGKCGHQTESWGDGDNSVKRCLALMREECEKGESNFYVAQD